VDERSFAPYLLLYLLATAILVRDMWTHRSVGLGCSHMFQLWLLYGSAACLRALPWSELLNVSTVYEGFALSAYGAAAFSVGWLFKRQFIPAGRCRPVPHDPRILKTYAIAGVITYIILQPLLRGVPSMQAVTASGQTLMLAGLSGGAFVAWRRNRWKSMVKWIVPALMLPMVTVLHQGFLGFGIMALSIVAIFCATFVQPRGLVVISFFVATYCSLSVYIAYMENRPAIRAAVWGGESYGERMSRVVSAIEDIRPFDFHNQHDLEVFDGRMDQANLVGLAAQRMATNEDYAKGKTLIDAFLGLIPRAVWKSKPPSGGSGDLVHRYTGLTFAHNTSVGVGSVLELYINFGTPCIIIGFFLLGLLLCTVDEKAALYLHGGDYQHFVLWFLFGISFLNAGGSFVETITSAGASLVAAHVANSIIAARARLRARRALSEARRMQPA